MCPGQRESGGKKRSAATRKGSKWLRGTLTECSKAVVRTKGTYLSARYHRIKSRADTPRRPSPPGRKILTAAYHVLDQGALYQELGEDFFYRRVRAAVEATGRSKLVFGAIGTNVCLTRATIAAAADGYEAWATIDISGTATNCSAKPRSPR